MGESRTELLCWLNDLLQLGYTKIEQCGTGAAHVQVLDSIYRDAPLTRVKFNAKHEYEYVANFKILQSLFDKHKIDNYIPVERLTKCKFQDNLEFMQWLKKYWDQYYPGGQYDAIGRRRGQGGSEHGGLVASPVKAAPKGMKKSISTASVTEKTPIKTKSAVKVASNTHLASSQWEKEKADMVKDYQRVTNDLTQQAMELKMTVEQVEKEREFYFSKLREIEIYIQNMLENPETSQELTPRETAYLKEIQSIMYKTEDGFEVPEQAVEGAGMEEDLMAATTDAPIEMY